MSLNVGINPPKTIYDVIEFSDVIELSNTKWPTDMPKHKMSSILHKAENLIKNKELKFEEQLVVCLRLLNRAAEANSSHAKEIATSKQIKCKYYERSCDRKSGDCRFSHCAGMIEAAMQGQFHHFSSASASSSSSSGAAPTQSNLDDSKEIPPELGASSSSSASQRVPFKFSSTAIPFVPKFVSSSSASSVATAPSGRSPAAT